MRYIFILTLFISGIAQADCDKNNSCNYTKEWSGFTKFITEYSAKKNGESTKFKYIQTDNELLIEVSSVKGVTSLFSINGVGTLYKNIGETGFKTAQECRPTVGDTYAILQSYAVRAMYFIGVGSQTTPTTLKGKQKITYEHKEGNSRVQINPGDHMNIGSPWNLSGTIEKHQEITYSIHHQHTVKNKLQDMFIIGSWSDLPTSNGIDNKIQLNDWLVCIGGKSNYIDGKYSFDPYITDTSNLKTIGQLRALTIKSTQTKNP